VSSTVDSTDARVLPPEFADLESVIEWALPTEAERYRKRMDSSMEEIQAFYDLVVSRAAAARDYLDGLDLATMPPDAQRLMWLLFSLISVSFAVEVFGVPRVPDSDAVYMERVGEPQTYPV
jgi:hypothetical protein